MELTPLVDVVFLLLIFFMVSTTFTKQGKLNITLPQAKQNMVAQQEVRSIDLAIDREGYYAVNGKVLSQQHKAHLARYLQQMITEQQLEQGDTAVVISADAKAPHQSVVTAMDVAAELGLSNLRISVAQD